MKFILLPLLAIFAVTGCSTMKKTNTPAPAPVMTTAQKEAEAAKALAAKAAAAKAAGESEMALLCKNAEDERKLEITSDGKGCVLNYTKFGKSQVIASSINGNKHCEDIMGKIQKNLEKSEYQCH